MSSPEQEGLAEARPEGVSPSNHSGHHDTKRQKTSHQPKRRKTACQSCRSRKVKCDNERPSCGFCQSSGVECVYIDNSEKITLDPATQLVVHRLDQILEGVDGINAFMVHQGRQDLVVRHESLISCQSRPVASSIMEPSRDYLQIPAHRTTADTVLTWPIYKQQYPPNYLIEPLFKPDTTTDTVVVPGGLRSLADEKIPALVDNFLQNVHTKNPILDVEALVRHARRSSEQGVGWDALSCLVLLACALGSLARPFDLTGHAPEHDVMVGSVSSAALYAKDIQQAESCYVLACRRIGLLKHTIIGAQCHFFAGVYLMYSLRPLRSWNHFHQASTSFLLYLKTMGGPNDHDSALIDTRHLNDMTRKGRRLEQSLYWSCFKSESEFRVELPFPQSEIADFEYPNMFPSPPSPPAANSPLAHTSPTSLHRFGDVNYGAGLHGLARIDTGSSLADDELELRQHSKRLCNEDESWYYYLTEVALRRIGNRVINTFYRQDFSSWMDIKPLVTIALEFDAQVSTWSANLPPAMQHYEISASIRAPSADPLLSDGHSSASKELSWATENRLLEMRSWLYQPFLYYAVHCGYPTSFLASPTYHADQFASPRSQPNGCPPATSNIHSILNNEPPPSLLPEDASTLRNMIASGVECNLKILDARSLLHRHHGLWYDLRSIMTAAIILLALVRSNNAFLIPGGAETLFGSNSRHNRAGDFKVGGKLRRVFGALQYWEDESPDMKRARAVLQELVTETRGMLHLT